MPRPKATNKVVPNSNVSDITEKEVWDVLQFASALYGGYPGVFTPDLLNRRMNDITMNPSIATEVDVEKALKSPKENQDQLIGYSEFFELTSSMYKRALHYLGTLLAFDLSFEPLGDMDITDFKSPAYQKDLKIAKDFLRRFKYKEEFSKIMQQAIRAETVYTFFRDDAEKYVFQEMPRKYSKITSRTPHGLSFNFNMLWFVQPSVDINLYPEVFKEYYNRVFTGQVRPNYMPSNPRQDGSWVYWVQTNHEDGAWAFKFTPEISTNVPFLAASFPDIVLQPMIRQLQKNQYIISASKMLTGEIPYLKDLKGAVIKDQLALDPTTLGKFLQLMKNGSVDALKISALPLQNIEQVEFKGDNEVYDSYNRSLAGTTGLNSSFLYSSDKKNAIEAHLAMNVDENIVRHMYSQFEDFLDYQINHRTKKYKFSLRFEGFNDYLDKSARYSDTIKLASMGFVDMNRIAHILGTDAFGLEKRLMMTQASGLVNLLTILPNANTAFGGEAGRPTMADGDLTDAGSASRDSAANENR